MRLEDILENSGTELNESAPGKKGKTTAKDAQAFIEDAANADFIKELKNIAKKMGGTTTVIEVLKALK